MDRLAEKYADRAVSSVFIYTREAHPGENYGYHSCMDDKRHNARTFKEQFQVQRPIFLDNLEGIAHKAYGILPNMTWIIGRGGIIHYKAAWTDTLHLEASLIRILENQARRSKDGLSPFYCETLEWRVRDAEGFDRGLERAGPQAFEDFYRDSKKAQ